LEGNLSDTLTSKIAILASAFRSPMAIAAPIPLLPPVSNAVFPSRENKLLLF